MKIPQYRSTEPLTAHQPPQVNPSVYSLPARAGIGLGEAISGAGSNLMEIVEREKQGREAIEVISAKTKAEIEIKNLERNVEKDADFDNYEKNYVPQIDEVLKKYLGGQSIGVQRKLKSSFEVLRGNSLLNLRSLRDKKSIDIGRAKTLETADLIESQIETESDPNELGKLYGRLDILLDETGGDKYVDPSGEERQGAGFFSAEHTQVLKNQYAGKIRDKIRKSNLNNVILRINAGEYTKEKVANLIKEYDIPKEAWPAIQSHATTIEKTQKIEDDEKNITNAKDEAKKEWPTSPDMQIILATNTEWQKNHGLDSKMAGELQTRLTKEHTLIHNIDDRKVGELLNKKDFVSASKLVASSGFLSGDEKRTWEDAIDKRKKKNDDDITPQEDATEYIMINNMIDRGVTPDTVKSYIAKSDHMKTGTRNKLLDRVDSETDKATKSGMAAGNKVLHTQIAPSRGMLYPVLPEQDLRSQEAQMALAEWVKTTNQKAVGGKGKPLTEREIYDHAIEIAPHYQLNMVEYMDALKREAQRETKPSGLGIKPPTPSSKEQYELNKVYTDAQGQKAKYLGNGKWQLVK